ncbi:MAG TPA: hypothetical protein VLG28_02190 [Acidimicrobiia bacterium]|nr:hypothetical protein [Acidimicrobiia bacterium]
MAPTGTGGHQTGTNSAEPSELESLATTLDLDADNIESWGQAAANEMYAFGYSCGATGAAGSTCTSAVPSATRQI